MTTAGNVFGGPWTERKLSIVEDYLRAYMTALKNQPFSKIYIDAFAGCGTPIITEEGERRMLFGSALRALEVEPSFDVCHFIEADPDLAAKLADACEGRRNVEIRVGDANTVVPRILCNYNWQSTRGVAFLDPYGLQVEWNAILPALAATRAMDVWYFFPLNAVLRHAPRNGEAVTEGFAANLAMALGTDDWMTFYAPVEYRDLFGSSTKIERVVDWVDIAVFVRERLRALFAGWVSEPMVFTNSRNSPMFALYLAVANPAPKAWQLAQRIAEALLRP